MSKKKRGFDVRTITYHIDVRVRRAHVLLMPSLMRV